MTHDTLCIYASEVAALAGLHKYTTQEEAVRTVLRRKGFVDAADRAQLQHLKCKVSVHVLKGIADAANDDAIAKKTVAHAKAQAAATKAQLARDAAATATAERAVAQDTAEAAATKKQAALLLACAGMSASEAGASAEILSDLRAQQQRANSIAAEAQKNAAVALKGAVAAETKFNVAKEEADVAQKEAVMAQSETVAARQKVEMKQKRAAEATLHARSAKRVADESRRLEHLEKDVAAVETPALQESIARAVAKSDTSHEAIKASALPENCSVDVKRALEGTVAKAMGVKQEAQNLREYEASVPPTVALNVKQRGYTLRGLTTAKNNPYTLFGRLDGLRDDGVVVESKFRKNRLFGFIPKYEKIQIMAYMALTKVSCAELVENFQGEQRIHDLSFDAVFWQHVIEELGKGVDQVYERIKRPDRKRAEAKRLNESRTFEASGGEGGPSAAPPPAATFRVDPAVVDSLSAMGFPREDALAALAAAFGDAARAVDYLVDPSSVPARRAQGGREGEASRGARTMAERIRSMAGGRIVWDDTEPLHRWIEAVKPSLVPAAQVAWVQVHSRAAGTPGSSGGGDFSEAPYQPALQQISDIIDRGANVPAAAKRECVERLLDTARWQGYTTGKWMVFLEPGVADAAWAVIARATATGELGCSAKVAPTGAGPDELVREAVVCCVYVRDFDERAELQRVLRALMALMAPLQVPVTAGFKPDAFTMLGIGGKQNGWRLPTTVHSVAEALAWDVAPAPPAPGTQQDLELDG